MKSKKGKITIISLVVAIVLTAFVISGTYAKYVSSIDLADEARVAIWDVNFGDNTVNVNLFKNSYFCDETGKNCSVKSLNSNDDKVVAPGTSGEYKFKINVVNSEVKYRIAINVIDATDDIGQLEYKLDDKELKCEETTGIDCLAETIEGLYNSGTEFDLDNYSSFTDSHTISWKWEFETDNDNNLKDTDLGKQAVIEAIDIENKNDPYNKQARVKLAFNIKVIQVTNPNGLSSAD